jgi:hypothetical protein
MRGGRRATACMIGAVSVGGWRTIFEGGVIEGLRRAATAPGRRRGLHVAQLRRAILPGARLDESRASRRPMPAAPPSPLAVAATAGRAEGDARGAEGAAGMIGAGPTGGGRPSWSVGHSPGCRRAACAPVAPASGFRWHNVLLAPAPRRPVPPPAARYPSPRPLRVRMGCARGGGRRIHQLHMPAASS